MTFSESIAAIIGLIFHQVAWLTFSDCCVCVSMQLNEMATELEDQRELATSRLTELEKLQQDHQEAVKEIETLKMDVRDKLFLCHCKKLNSLRFFLAD